MTRMGGTEFSLASERGDKLRAQIAPKAELLHVIYASSWDEAMIAYHAWQGWGPYKPLPGLTDKLYDDEFLRENEIVISRA